MKKAKISLYVYMQFMFNICLFNHNYSGKVTDPSVRNMFTHIGSIIVEKKGDLEQATEDAILVGAEDVEEFEENDNKYLQV